MSLQVNASANSGSGFTNKNHNQESMRSFAAAYVDESGKATMTHVNHSCNIINLVFACCCGGCWYCHQIFKHKDLNCYNADHFLDAGKSQQVAAYSAC